MDVDITQPETRRSLDQATTPGGPGWRLTVSRRYRAEQSEVWDALTNAERLPRWFLPVTGDLVVGGRFQLEGNAGGEVLRCVPPEHLAVTWEYDGAVSWVDVDLRPDGDHTVLELVHTAPVPEPLWEQFGPGAVGIGWDLALHGLAGHLGDGPAVDPAQAEAWAASAEGVELMTQSSTAWAAASVAAGTDPAQARAAAERCLAAYTATEQPA